MGSKGAYLISNANSAIIGFDYRKEVWVYDLNKLLQIDNTGPTSWFSDVEGRHPILVDCFEVR